ncbi:hypothetical protein ABW20_dc0110433 [Dactylellina cionopaga]|nr:hypothetical protein ABW20_dc0110433 [Dactylellina cionopaga]
MIGEDPAGDIPLDTHPGLQRRSTSNYKQSSEEYKKQLEEDDDNNDQAAAEEADSGGRRSSVTSKPFKPGAKRTKSWDYRDKRGEMQMTMMKDDEQPGAGFSET